ncbi:MAG: GGDEF domain-containing phosphodiesterase [Spirochaetales bacterium]
MSRGKIDKLTQKLEVNEDTGLPNAVVMNREMEGLLKATPDSKAVLFLSLTDQYTTLKRTSPSKPQWILFNTAIRIMTVVAEHGRVYHTREEEFLILLEDLHDPVAVTQLASEIVKQVKEAYVLNGQTISLGVNIGIALYPEQGESKSILLRHADIALSESIKNKSMYQLFTPELRDRMIEKDELQKKILKALEVNNSDERPQLMLYFQPQVEIRNWNTPEVQGRVVGAEVLIRWNHPTDGFIPPGKFIPVAEETGLIVHMGTWILHTAISCLQDLALQGYGTITVSVNISSVQMNMDDFIPRMKEIVRRLKTADHPMKLELTESGMVNIEDTIKKIGDMKEMGFKILLDDFGTGYSSLSYLKDLPIDVVKIDKSFVDGVPAGEKDTAMTRTIITLAKELRKDIIVEGTEHREQIDWLFDHGCTVYQGYYFSKPLPYSDFVQYLKNFPAIFEEKSRPN